LVFLESHAVVVLPLFELEGEGSVEVVCIFALEHEAGHPRRESVVPRKEAGTLGVARGDFLGAGVDAGAPVPVFVEILRRVVAEVAEALEE